MGERGWGREGGGKEERHERKREGRVRGREEEGGESQPAESLRVTCACPLCPHSRLPCLPSLPFRSPVFSSLSFPSPPAFRPCLLPAPGGKGRPWPPWQLPLVPGCLAWPLHAEREPSLAAPDPLSARPETLICSRDGRVRCGMKSAAMRPAGVGPRACGRGRKPRSSSKSHRGSLGHKVGQQDSRGRRTKNAWNF